MSRKYEIQRSTVYMYNDTPVDILASKTYQSTNNVLEKASDYTAVVESASIDLSGMVLNPDPNYKIMIYNNDKSGAFPDLPDINNIFSLNTPVAEVEDVLVWLYNILHKKALPYDLGHFDVDAEGYFSLSLSNAEAYTSGDIEVWFNTRLKEIFPEYLSAQHVTQDGEVYYKLNITGAIPTPWKQKKYTLSRLLTAISIHFYTDMQTTAHNTQTAVADRIVGEHILNTITINTETFDVLNKYNMVYSPQQLRHVTMNNDQELRTFSLWVKIFYKGGRYQHHTLKPGDYTLVNIAFYPRPEIVREEEEEIS